MTKTSITEYLYAIKENIKLIENGSREPAVLDNIETDFYEMLELIKLFLISERDSYYGYFMMNMTFKANFYIRSIAGIRLDAYPPVFESNPLLLCTFSLKEIIFVVCHEIEHIILNHPAEMLKANPTQNPKVFHKFNIAADASVNDRLRDEIETQKRSFMTVPDDCILSGTIEERFHLKGVKPLESYYYYYELIKDLEADDPENDEQGENGGNGDSDGESVDIITTENCGEREDHNWQAGDDAEDVTAVIRDFINASYDMMDDDIRGLMPARFIEQVRFINTPPKISWQQLLKKYVGTISVGKHKTRTRLNRRQPSRYDLSGEIRDKILKIVVAIDTSASVSEREVAMIFREIFAILSKRKFRITVIECDSEIQRIYIVNSPDDIKPNVAGRGGTSFTPVIEHINSDKYYRDALLIYFTDGYGEKTIPKPLTYRNLWVVTGHREELSLDQPYGTVVAFEE